MILLYVTLFRTLNTILGNKRRSNAHIGTFKTNRDVMWHTEHEEGQVSCSGVYCFLPTCTQCSLSWELVVYVCHCQCTTIILRMACKIQFKRNYLIVQYCTPAHIWPWYNPHLWITDLVNRKFFPLWVGWTTYLSWKHNSCSQWTQDCCRQHDSAWAQLLFTSFSAFTHFVILYFL